MLGASATSLASLPATAAPRPATHPDSELLEVCGEFIACDKEQRAVHDGPGALADDEAAIATAPIFARMYALGMAARAHSLTLWDAELMTEKSGDVGRRLTCAIVRDLLGKIGA